MRYFYFNKLSTELCFQFNRDQNSKRAPLCGSPCTVYAKEDDLPSRLDVFLASILKLLVKAMKWQMRVHQKGGKLQQIPVTELKSVET